MCPPGIALLERTQCANVVAAPTILGRELHLDDGIATVIEGRRPADAGLAGWTGRVLLVPINREVLGIKAGPLAGLPVIVEAGGPQQIHAIVAPDS